MMGHVPREFFVRMAHNTAPQPIDGGREPCPLCNGLGGWDRHGNPIPVDGNVPERTTCQGCGGCGEFVGWLREAMKRSA